MGPRSTNKQLANGKSNWYRYMLLLTGGAETFFVFLYLSISEMVSDNLDGQTRPEGTFDLLQGGCGVFADTNRSTLTILAKVARSRSTTDRAVVWAPHPN